MLQQVGIFRQLAIAVAMIVAAGAAWLVYESMIDASGGAASDGGRRGGVERPIPVIVSPVRIANDDLRLEAVGTGRAIRSVTLRAEASGRVVQMPLAAGRWFEAGDELLRIDDTEEQLALSLAETRLADAQRTLKRLDQLRGRGAASASSLDDARTAFSVAQIELERAKEALENHIVRAPFAGVAGIPAIEPGAWVDNDVDIASFDDRSTILVEFDLPEALLARVTNGLAVSATTPAVPGRRFEGEVVAVDSRIAATSRSVRVRVAFPNPADVLRPGASFAVRLDLPGDAYPTVPELAVQFATDGLHVWRVIDDGVEKVPVRMVRRRAGAVLVDGNLAADDRVVIEGTQRLAPGRTVRVIGSDNEGST